MECSKCEKKAVYEQTNQALCKNHFLDYFETKAFKTINKYKLFQRGDRICVASSGGKDSLALLYITMKYCKKNDIKFFALAIDEGIAGYRDHTLDDLEKFCSEFNIPLKTVAFKDKFGTTLDQVRDKAIKEFNKKPCTVCGIFRRTLLNRGARDLKATKLATGHNLDDVSQSYFMNTLKGNMRMNASLGPISGIQENSKFVTRVKPLYFISEQETRLFCFLRKFKVEFSECPNIHLSFRAKVRDQLNEIEMKNPGSKAGMVNAFLEILPDLKKKYANKKDFAYCSVCSDPCVGDKCNSCELEEQLCIPK